MTSLAFNKVVEFQLPTPWIPGITFRREFWGYINFLVGPNGSGKTRFASELISRFDGNKRFLRADRLVGLYHKNNMGHWGSARNYQGFSRSEFGNLKSEAQQTGIGGDAFILLEEKLDLRIRIEATLSQIFNREIRLEWDSGKLIPKAYNLRVGGEYTLHNDECHGLQELLILLSHLYDDSNNILFIDEPELNLHPQYQSFLMAEIKKVAGPPEKGKKLIFLITHSPYMLDISNLQNLKSVLCFHHDFGLPTSLDSLTEEESHGLLSLLTRLNTHHKQLFFAAHPVFVEGIFDAQLFSTIQERREVSMEGAGACFIDVNGKNELIQYFKLVNAFGKNGKYILDLDALLDRDLRASAGNDKTVIEHLVVSGAGTNFSAYVGQLETALNPLITSIKAYTGRSTVINDIKQYFTTCKKEDMSEDLKRMRIACMVLVGENPTEVDQIVGNMTRVDIESKRDVLLNSLKQAGIFILKSGCLENYCPTYGGSRYKVNADSKKSIIEKELEIVSNKAIPLADLEQRYHTLWEILSQLPAAPSVDYETAIKVNLSGLIYSIQVGVSRGNITTLEQAAGYLGDRFKIYQRILNFESFSLGASKGDFNCSIILKDLWGIGVKRVRFSNTTPAGTFAAYNLENV